MTDKALISEYTWRSLEMQRAAFPDMQTYVAPHDLPQLLRPTSRKENITIHVMSLAVIAPDVDDFKYFMRSLTYNITIHSSEEGWTIGRRTPIKKATVLFRSARKFNIQKIGGKISAEKREKESKEACDRIRDRWPLPSKTWRTPVLLKEADIAYNTAVKFLGPRPIAQYNHQAKLKRKKLKEERINV